MTAPGSTSALGAQDALGAATDRASDVAHDATAAASDVASTAKDQASQVLGDTVEQAKDLTAEVRQQSAELLSSQSEKVTSQLRTLSEQLSNGDASGLVGQLLIEGGRRLQALTDHVERVGPDGLLRDARNYARNNPGTFLVGAALAGLVSGRVMKGASRSPSEPSPAQFSPAGPRGTATGDPLAGVSEPSLGETAGYETTPYPDISYDLPNTLSYSESRGGQL